MFLRKHLSLPASTNRFLTCLRNHWRLHWNCWFWARLRIFGVPARFQPAFNLVLGPLPPMRLIDFCPCVFSTFHYWGPTCSMTLCSCFFEQIKTIDRYCFPSAAPHSTDIRRTPNLGVLRTTALSLYVFKTGFTVN